MTAAVPEPEPVPALDPAGPEVVLGGTDPIRPEIRPEPASLFGPRSARAFGPEGPLVIADTGHHRLVIHQSLPDRDGRPADLVLGQPDFQTEGRNAGRDEPTPETLNVPVGVCPIGPGLAVADGWNNRVLIWHRFPERSGQPADLVLGQTDFRGQAPNRGRNEADPGSMHWPFQVLTLGESLWVADTGNRRVLVWRCLPTENGQPADWCIGQSDLHSRSDNGGQQADRHSLRWPHDLTRVGDRGLAVADAGNNRILVWNDLPWNFSVPADCVLGQADFEGVDHNRGRYWPTADALNMPYAVASDARGGLLVADTANSRLVGYRPSPAGSPNPWIPTDLTGQPHFGAKGDNRNRLPERDSLCWPYGLQITQDLAVVADTGNHRVLLWRVFGG